MKTYVLTVSRVFPKTHKQAGVNTYFQEQILNAINGVPRYSVAGKKIHTIRGNYDLWAKRAEQINAGKAILSLRYWSGDPYNSKQVTFAILEKIGVQKLIDPNNIVAATVLTDNHTLTTVNWDVIASNDGLSFNDFCEWFKGTQEDPLAIIHFTNFRYTRP